MDTGEDRVNLLSNRIIGCAFTVLHTLGTGFLEKVYQNALVHELRKSGHRCLLLKFGKPRLEIKRIVLAL
jgi:hypothetical protein